MTELEIRRMIDEGLQAGSCFTLRNNGWTEDFLAGRRDVSFDEMDMDSLAAMEVCIAIEINSGVTVLPDDLREHQTLGGLVVAVQRGLP